MKEKEQQKKTHHKPKENSFKKISQRKILSFWRVCSYGLESFVRNSWLSVAATAVMIITLMIILSACVIQSISTSTIEQLRKKVDMSIYLSPDTDKVAVNSILVELKKLKTVVSVKFISSDAARQQIAKENAGSVAILEAIKEATNKTPATVKVVIKDINDTSELQNFVNTNSVIKDHISTDYKPSFAGERKQSIQVIGQAVSFTQKAAIAAGTLFVVISSLIIFNTIQMAIFNRKEEIQMMKLIGANISFIRGPFLIESIFYGVIAAVIASGLGIFFLTQSRDILSKYLYVDPTIDFVMAYALPVTLCMMLLGSVIGVISSLLATRRYLKI
jgi:cell division transport system permease protein